MSIRHITEEEKLTERLLELKSKGKTPKKWLKPEDFPELVEERYEKIVQESGYFSKAEMEDDIDENMDQAFNETKSENEYLYTQYTNKIKEAKQREEAILKRFEEPPTREKVLEKAREAKVIEDKEKEDQELLDDYNKNKWKRDRDKDPRLHGVGETLV